MGCSSSHAAAVAVVSNEPGSSNGQLARSPIPSVLTPSPVTSVVPSITTAPTSEESHHEAANGALSARSIGFNETYTPIRLLGKGSFGKVKLCESAGGGLVAVKICRCSFLDPQAANAQRGGRRGSLRRNDKLEALKKEISIMKRLSHPHIVKLHYILEDILKGKMYMVMDFVEGGSVSQRMTGDDGSLRPLSEETTRKFMTDLLVALSYMHANGVVHRDVKPENMLISGSGDIQLSDFGVSEFINKNSSGDELDLSSVTSGTPAFLAPECCQIGEFHTKRADVWAAGVSMFYMLFGAVPFVDKEETLSIAGQMRSIVEQPLVFPQDHSVSSEALDLLTQLLEKDPERRISLDAALLSPWITAARSSWQPSLKRLPSGLPDNDILPDASAMDVDHAVINVSNWVLLVKVKQIASRHVQGFRDRRKSQDESIASSTLSSAAGPGAASGGTTANDHE